MTVAHFEDLHIGDRFDDAPAVTLTSGLAAAHQAIVGGRLRLALDARLSRAVTRRRRPFASPALVWDVSIGQSTQVTRNALANLFYRGLRFQRAPSIGDTLATATTVVGLGRIAPRADRPPRGKVMLHIRTTDQQGRVVLDFHRCAMLPAREEGPDGSLGVTDLPAPRFDADALSEPVARWHLDACAGPAWPQRPADLAPGLLIEVPEGDVVSSAPELARMTLNLAAIHHDRTRSGSGRLVYGGHAIGLALAQASRALPSLLTVLAWGECSHLGPVREGDTLHSGLSVEACLPRAAGGTFAVLRSRVRSTDAAGGQSDVLDWRFVGLLP